MDSFLNSYRNLHIKFVILNLFFFAVKDEVVFIDFHMKYHDVFNIVRYSISNCEIQMFFVNICSVLNE